MKAKAMRELVDDDLRKQILTLRREEFVMRMQISSGSTKVKIHRFKVIQREIARVKTILNERKD